MTIEGRAADTLRSEWGTTEAGEWRLLLRAFAGYEKQMLLDSDQTDSLLVMVQQAIADRDGARTTAALDALAGIAPATFAERPDEPDYRPLTEAVKTDLHLDTIERQSRTAAGYQLVRSHMVNVHRRQPGGLAKSALGMLAQHRQEHDE